MLHSHSRRASSFTAARVYCPCPCPLLPSPQERALTDPVVRDLVEYVRDLEEAAVALAGVIESAAAYPADYSRLYAWPWPQHARRSSSSSEDTPR